MVTMRIEYIYEWNNNNTLIYANLNRPTNTTGIRTQDHGIYLSQMTGGKRPLCAVL